MDLGGKTVLLTGASRGLGVHMAKAFAREGSKLALAARSEPELRSVQTDLEAMGANVIVVQTDVSDRDSLENLVKETENALGPVDILINNAGIEAVVDFEEMDLDLIEQIIQVNVTGLVSLTRMVVPSMIERRAGQIVNISSMAGLSPVPHNAVYSTSKHAVVGFSRSLRLELKEFNVGVSVVCPGFVTEGMFLTWGRKAPAAVGAVSPEAVTKATLQAAKKNIPEIKVIPPLGKSSPTVLSLSPRLNGFLMEKLGVTGYLRDQARINRER